jgi:flagellar basal-body rod protein FlgB
MSLENMGFFKVLTTRMDWLSDRQRLLAENVANANTPSYRARDLEQPDFQDLLRRKVAPVALKTTVGGHMQGRGFANDAKFKVREIDAMGDKSGNNVALETEMMKVAQTAADHELMSNLYKKGMGMLRIALSRPSRG